MKRLVQTICLLLLAVAILGCSRSGVVERGASSQALLKERLEGALRSRDFDGLRLLHSSTHLEPDLGPFLLKHAETFTEIKILTADGVHPIRLNMAELELRPTPTGSFLVRFPKQDLPTPDNMPPLQSFRFGQGEDGRWYLCTFVEIKKEKAPNN